MSKIVINRTEKGICVSRGGGDIAFHRPGHTASAEALLAIFDELQVDGVAVIERPKAEPVKSAVRTHIQSEDYVEGVSGWRIDTADGSIKMFKKNVSISAVDTRAVFTQKPLKDREPDRPAYAPLPFIVQADKFYINDANIKAIAEPAQIGEAMAAHSVTNICHQVNHYGGEGLTEERAREIALAEIAKASKPGGALWSPK